MKKMAHAPFFAGRRKRSRHPREGGEQGIPWHNVLRLRIRNRKGGE